MVKYLLWCQLTLLSLACTAQTVIIKRVQLAGEKIIVIYDLEDSNPNNEYLLNLYSSKDNFAKAAVNVTGDVGMDIKPGTDKKIEWNVVKEFGGYKGKLSLEIRGKVYVPFVRLQGFDPKGTFRRGKNYQLAWKAGNSNPINIELYKSGERISGEVNHPNNGAYTLFIPKHVKPGKGYKIKFSDSRNSEEMFYTGEFAIKPKIPLLLKVAPVVVVGVVLFVLTSKEKANTSNDDSDIKNPGFPPDTP